ncbi:hypothetical protein RNM29_33380, partial [Pseudomonas aeruginosa]
AIETRLEQLMPVAVDLIEQFTATNDGGLDDFTQTVPDLIHIVRIDQPWINYGQGWALVAADTILVAVEVDGGLDTDARVH